MRIPFDLLHTFVVAARARRMSAAAATLHLTPGAISQRIRDLETLVGHRLLVRSAKGVEVTRAGHRLFEEINNPLRELEAAYAGLSGRRDSPRIVVTTTPSFAASWLVERLAEFSLAHSEI